MGQAHHQHHRPQGAGSRLRWVKRDRARLLELVSSRMCEAQADVVARSAALWLRLRGFTGAC